MGFKQALVLAPISFLLGVLFICFTVDHRVLWTALTEEVIADGVQFYRTFYNAPPAIQTLLHTMMGAGLLGFIVKLHKWDDSAMLFDGCSLAMYVFALALYIGVVGSGLRTIALPVTELEAPEVQIESLRVLSAGNVLMIGLLIFILVLQGGQEFAARSEAAANAKLQAEHAAKQAEKKQPAVVEEKKKR